MCAGLVALVADEPPTTIATDDAVLQRTYRQAMLIDVRGPIFDSQNAYISRRLEAAQRGGVDLLLLRITSPGGELDASMELARRLSEIDWATTVAFIPEEAYSGAAIIALGCDRIYMRPRAVIGDAGPIQFHDGQFEHADEKIVSALAVALHQLAIAKKRPGAIAEAMVDRHLVVYEAISKVDQQKTFLTAQESQQPANQADYEIGPALPESGQDRFLTVGGLRAVELQLAEGTFDSEQELLDHLQIERLSETRRTWIDQLVYFLNRPWVTGLLLVLGVLGLMLEFSIPGTSVPGLISACCFTLFFWSHVLGGTSGWLEILLFILGLLCLALEIFILPGFGVFGISGVLMLMLSLIMASQDFVLPASSVEWATLRTNLLIVLGTLAVAVIVLVVQVLLFDSLPGLGRFRLDAPVASAGDSMPLPSPSSASLTPMGQPEVGAAGVAESILRPAGKARFATSLVDVITEGDYVEAGCRVEVIRRQGNQVIVRKIKVG